MPIYEIEQYELHSQTYQVEANSEAEAIKKLFDGQAQPMDDGFDLVEVAREYGLPLHDHRELHAQLRTLNVATRDDVIPSIRSVRRVE